MRRLIITGPGRVQLEDGPQRQLEPGELRLVPEAVGICGSDVHGLAGATGRRLPGTVMGHEVAGTVVEAADVEDRSLVGRPVAVNPVLTCGRCAACRSGAENRCAARRLYGCVPELPGGFAETMVVAAHRVVPLAAGTSVDVAALAEPCAVGEHAAAVAAVTPDDVVLVVGGGTIGIATALAVRRRGASVRVSEPSAPRRRLLERLGLDAVAPDDARLGDAYDTAIDCVGVAATVATALDAVPAGGTVVLVGLAERTVAVPAAALVMGERRMEGSAVYTSDEFRRVVAWLESDGADVAPLIGRRVRLDELPAAFAGAARGADGAVKILYHR